MTDWFEVPTQFKRNARARYQGMPQQQSRAAGIETRTSSFAEPKVPRRYQRPKVKLRRNAKNCKGAW